MKSSSKRKEQGNMLIVVSLCMGLIGLAIVGGMSFAGLFLAQSLLQNFANQAALSAACTLNGGNQQAQASGINACDRMGQMNNMIARSRAEVFESRTNLGSSAELDGLQGIADQLCTSARDGATTLEQERQKLKSVVEAEATAEVSNQIQAIQKFQLILPWIQLSSARLLPGGSGIAFGQINGVQSTVSQLDASNNLNTIDASKGYTSASKRYLANINAQLTGADSDLNFHLSSLQPPVNHDVAPARLVLPAAFESVPTGDGSAGDLPSAVKVTLVMNVETELFGPSKSQIVVTGVATTTGGGEMR